MMATSMLLGLGYGVRHGHISFCLTCPGKKLRTLGLCPKMGHRYDDTAFYF